MNTKTTSHKKRFFCVFLLAALLLAGCSDPSVPGQKEEDIKTSGGGNVLTVYCQLFSDPALSQSYIKLRRDTEKRLRELAPEADDLEIVYYDPTGGDTTMDYSTANNRMMADILAGKGPDLILGDSDVDRVAGADVTRQARSGVYADLSPYLESDSRFDAIPAE